MMATRRRLPFRITLLLTVVLITTVLNAVRFGTAIAWRHTLGTYVGAPEVVYVALSGAFWTLAGLYLFWSFWRGGRRVPVVYLATSVVYAAWSWADRLVVQTSLRANWLFALVVTILLLVFVAIVVLDPHNQFFFGKETYERKPEESPTT